MLMLANFDRLYTNRENKIKNAKSSEIIFDPVKIKMAWIYVMSITITA